MGSNSLQKIEDIVLDHSLVPCEICGRTFLPDPLKKHQKVCERNATRKRKVFDSLKQRVLGTDLEPFHQRTYLRKPPESVAPVPTHTIPYTQPIVCSAPKATRHSKWKEKHLELMKAIRIAKGASPNEMSSKRSTAALRGPSTERCPSCDRQFGPKAFDRHVQWCKERQTRIQRSPASVLIAKERLEARTKYRVPPLGKSRRTTNREKYSPHVNRAESVSSVRTESSSNFERSPSTRKPKSVTNVMRIDTRKSEEQNSRTSVNETPKKSSGDTAKIPEPTYNPFITAERQLMELLECDDFKPYASKTPHIDRPHTTNVHNHNKTTQKTQPKAIKSADKATKTKPSEVLTNGNRPNTRSSIIDPPTGFDDTILHDEFEFIENFINDNFSDVKTAANNQKNKHDGGSFFLHQKQNDALNLKTILNERKYSDDLSSIDPNLINENDNLSIPDHLKSEEYSPTSSLGNYSSDATIRNVNEPDVYSVQYDNKIASLEPQIPKRPLDLVDELDQFLETLDSGAKPSPLVKTKSLRGNAKTKEAKKSTVSLVSSGGASAAKGGSKKNLSSLKRSISLMDPVPKPKPMKSKEDVRHYFQEQEMKSPTKNGRVSPEKGDGGVADASLKPEELFSVDDELYEEYKKYEEMYLKEKEEKLRNERKMAEMTTGVCTASEDDDCSGQTGNKISADSAYGSLNRKAPKVRARSTKLTPLEHQRPADAAGSLSSSSSETSPTPKNAAQRVPKFCHECGNKYPLTSAKFCVECGVKRLVL